MQFVFALIVLLFPLFAHVDTARAQAGAASGSGRAARVVRVPADADLQAAIDAAEPGTTLELTPGAVYRSAVIRKRTTRLTLTTGGFNVGDRAPQPSDAPAMASIQGSAGS